MFTNLVDGFKNEGGYHQEAMYQVDVYKSSFLAHEYERYWLVHGVKSVRCIIIPETGK